MVEHYHTVFKIGIQSIPWGAIWVPLIMIVIGLVLIRLGRVKQIRQVVGGATIIFSLLIIFLLGTSIVSEFLRERHAYAAGQFSVVEGPIQDFHPMPPLGRAKESFVVNGVNFAYDVGDSTPCFHDSAAFHKIVQAGLEIRIFYTNGCILRLDVRQ